VVRKKMEVKEVDVMEDQIAAANEGAPRNNDYAHGTVKWFSRMKGWGFIEPDGGDRDVFVHYENIAGEGFKNLEKGERVQFHVESTPKGPKAINVSSTGMPEETL